MDKIETELRDLFRTNLNTTHSLEAGTTATNLRITAHGLSTGDSVSNTTRSENYYVTVVDDNNLTVEASASQVGDSVTFLRFKKYYVGKIFALPVNYLPVLSVYGTKSKMAKVTNQTDQWMHQITIEAYINAFAKVSESELTNDVLQAQSLLKKLMEERDANGIAKANTIVGVLRRNIKGSNFLYTDDYEILYDFYNAKDAVYYRATLNINAAAQWVSRS